MTSVGSGFENGCLHMECFIGLYLDGPSNAGDNPLSHHGKSFARFRNHLATSRTIGVVPLKGFVSFGFPSNTHFEKVPNRPLTVFPVLATMCCRCQMSLGILGWHKERLCHMGGIRGRFGNCIQRDPGAMGPLVMSIRLTLDVQREVSKL